MKNILLIISFLFLSVVSYSQERYYEVSKLYIQKADGTSEVEKHDIALLFSEESQTVSVRIDKRETEVFKIVSSNLNQQTGVKTYELLHADGREVTVTFKKKRIKVVAHTTGKAFETEVNYDSKIEKQ